MRLIDIINGTWAITPDMLAEIQSIYGRHLRGDKIDLQQLTAATGIVFDNQPKNYSVQDGVAVIPVDGVIAKKMNLMTRISGGTSSDLVGRDFEAALNDRSVEAIVLAIDSPGGTVDGTPELAQIIAAARGKKPVCAVTDGMMCSAAYWIGSAADRVFISSEVAMVGSIGVVSQHVDVSASEAKQGIKTTEIYAGKYKRIASQYAPLTTEGRQSIQDAVDHVYSVFIDAVANHRNTDAETVLGSMADGRVFHGSQAITAGLVDGVATLSDTINIARDMARKPQKSGRAGVARATTNPKEKIMTLDEFKADHPELVEAITAEATIGMDAAVSAARVEGAAAERERIASVRATLIPGHEALIEQLAMDGASTAADAALAIVTAEKGIRQAYADTIIGEANAPVDHADAGDGAPRTLKRADFDAMPQNMRRAYLADGGKITD